MQKKVGKMDIQIEKMLITHLNMINLEEFDDFWNINMLKEELENPLSFYIIAKIQKKIVRIFWS